MTKKLSVLILSSWYPARTNPTLGNFNEKFAEAAALFNKVTALHIAADENMSIATEYVQTENNGVDTRIVYFRKKHKEFWTDKVAKSYRFLKYYFTVYKQYKKQNGKPDIVHLNILYPVGIIALLFKKIYGLPYVISENWTGYLPSNYIRQNFLVRITSRIIAKNAYALLPVSLDLKKAMLSHGFNNTYYIVPNVTDTKHFNLSESAKVDEKKIMLHVSSLKDEHKNITGILNVVKQLSIFRQDFELHIVGDGDAAPHKKYAEELNLLNKFVFFYEAMTPLQIAQIMKQSDFFVLFSNYENLPCVIVEALASGLPVVSSTAGGIPEHITEDKGILVEPKDEKAFFNACVKMLDNYSAYNKINLHRYAVDKFSYISVGQQLTDIYNVILKKKQIDT